MPDDAPPEVMDCADLIAVIAYEEIVSLNAVDRTQAEQQFREQLVKLIDERIEARVAQSRK